MKTIFTLRLVGMLGAASLSAVAEPVSQTCVEETFFGSSPTSYAIIGTETEPLADGVQTRHRTWLDEYEKQPVLIYDFKSETDNLRNGAYITKLVHSILLLDGQEAPIASGSAVAEVKKESAPSLAALVAAYPQRTLTPWPAEQMGELKHDVCSFFTNYKTQTLINGETLRARMGGLREGDAELLKLIGQPVVESIAEDGNCTYVTLSTATEKSKQTRVFCLVPAITRNLHSVISRAPLYLSAGRFETQEEALRAADKFRGKLKSESGFANSSIEIWAHESTGYLQTFYFVVVTETLEVIRQRKVEALEKLLGLHLLLVKSDSFSVLIDGADAKAEP